MPDYSLMTDALGDEFDPENSAGRFNPHLAVVILVADPDPMVHGSPENAVAKRVGAWVLEHNATLGEPRAVDGSIGRGAEGWAPVVEWTADAIGQGIVDLMLAGAAAKVLHSLRRRNSDVAPEESAEPVRFYISRGMAAAVAADHVASSLNDRGPLEIEAVEEPSSIAGVAVIEASYVGVEPWVVLLRNAASGRRYYVVVAPDGEIMGHIDTPLIEFEAMFLRPLGDDAPTSSAYIAIGSLLVAATALAVTVITLVVT